MEKMLFDGWEPLTRTVVVGVLAYVNLVLVLRISGARTLSKLNAYDFVVTVALGSTFATILLNKDVSLAQGSLALALLAALQFVVTWSSVRFAPVRRLMTGEPTLLLRRGTFLQGAMRAKRVTEDEIRAAIRAAGHGSMNVEAVVLETNGELSVLDSSPTPGASSLEGVDSGSRS